MMKLGLMTAVLALSTSALTLVACQSETEPVPGEPPPIALDDTSEVTFCGGIAGLQCPTGFVCTDNPFDNCDPDDGGADCGGVCVEDEDACTVPGREYISTDQDVCMRIRFKCDGKLVAFADECGCGCEPPPPSRIGACGGSRCGADERCCNESCGICASIDG